MREKLAELVHGQWSGWMKHLFDKGVFNDDGTWTMPAWAVGRWTWQMETPYSKLFPAEQERDKEEADKILASINEKNKRLCCCIPNQDKLDQSCQNIAVYQIWFGNHPTIDDFTETCTAHLEQMMDDNVRFEVLRIPEAA